VKTRSAARGAWSVWAICIASIAIGGIAGLVHHPENDPGVLAPTITTMLFLLAFATVGALVASRRPEHPIGWILLACGVLFAAGGIAVTIDPDSRDAAAQWVSGWVWGAGAFLALTLPFLLFPDGKLPSRRWRIVGWAAVTGIVTFVVSNMFEPGSMADTTVRNPLGLELGGAGRTFFAALRGAGAAIVIVAGICSVVSLFFRYHRAERTEREQLRWLMYAGAIVVIAVFAQGPASEGASTPELAVNIQNAITAAALTLIPIAIGIAILKYRLYDIDLVIRKTVVVGAMALFISLIYALIVGLGSQLFSSSTLSFVAAAVLAVGFQPARERARRLADRLVYGKRATPYEVLADFSGRMGEAYADDDVLPRMAQVLAAGTGAEEAVVWLRVGDALQPSAMFPPGAAPPPRPPEDAVDVLHQGEPLGALSVTMPASDPMDPSRRKLVEDLAAQAGLVLRNVRLIEDIRASRQRLVAAQDEERRRIERNIHDGAQQQLVALAVQLKLARTMLDRDRGKAGELIEGLRSRAADALEELRDLARGIYPPLLADRGLPAALEAQARKALLPVTIDSDGVGRYEQQVESAVYFSVLEALQNVTKYADATSATVRLSAAGDRLTFQVIDDGRGFDVGSNAYGTGLRGIADRLAALGGDLDVQSTPGRGTVVIGNVPARELEVVA